jgi:hypothetical protein
MAARAAIFFAQPEGMNLSSPLPMGNRSGSVGKLNIPVIESSVFVDENLEGWTMVRRRRWSPASVAKVRDLRLKEVSKSRALGQAGLRAGANFNLVPPGPSRSR